MNQMVLAALAGIGIGLAAGVLILCAWGARNGASPDPRCALRLPNYVEHHQLTANRDRVTCRHVVASDD